MDDFEPPLIEQFRLASEEWVDKDAAARLMEETKSSVFAQKCAALGDIPVNRAEQIVKASADWYRHLLDVVEAKTAANKAKLRRDYLEMRYYEQQRHDANRRAEIKMLGGAT